MIYYQHDVLAQVTQVCCTTYYIDKTLSKTTLRLTTKKFRWPRNIRTNISQAKVTEELQYPTLPHTSEYRVGVVNRAFHTDWVIGKCLQDRFVTFWRKANHLNLCERVIGSDILSPIMRRGCIIGPLSRSGQTGSGESLKKPGAVFRQKVNAVNAAFYCQLLKEMNCLFEVIHDNAQPHTTT